LGDITVKSPYLAHALRLADVLAAIQVMGSHLWDSRPVEDWKLNLGERPQSIASWEELFTAHPEFFGSRKSNDGRMLYYLRLRRAYERTIDPTSLDELSAEEIETRKKSGSYESDKLSRRGLTPEQVETLMKTAIELQVRAAALEDRSKWWIPLAAAVLGFVGAVLGSLLKPT
jgi:hypothetical protein